MNGAERSRSACVSREVLPQKILSGGEESLQSQAIPRIQTERSAGGDRIHLVVERRVNQLAGHDAEAAGSVRINDIRDIHFACAQRHVGGDQLALEDPLPTRLIQSRQGPSLDVAPPVSRSRLAVFLEAMLIEPAAAKQDLIAQFLKGVRRQEAPAQRRYPEADCSCKAPVTPSMPPDEVADGFWPEAILGGRECDERHRFIAANDRITAFSHGPLQSMTEGRDLSSRRS